MQDTNSACIKQMSKFSSELVSETSGSHRGREKQKHTDVFLRRRVTEVLKPVQLMEQRFEHGSVLEESMAHPKKRSANPHIQ